MRDGWRETGGWLVRVLGGELEGMEACGGFGRSRLFGGVWTFGGEGDGVDRAADVAACRGLRDPWYGWFVLGSK